MALLGWQNAIEDSAVSLTASAAAGGYSVENLRVPLGAPSVAWQTPAGTTAASLTISSPASISWRAACLARTNLSTGATMRVRVGEPAAFTEATPIFATSPITPGWTSTGTVTRAHTPSTATATYFAAGGVLTEAAQSIPRVAYDPTTGERLGWLLEPARQNLLRNPRAEGAAAGSPGTLPTYWYANLDGTGVTVNVVGSGAEDGIPYVDIRYSGAAVGNQRFFVGPDNAFMPIGAAVTFTMSAYVRLIAGTAPAVAWNPNYYTAANAYITETATALITPTTATLKSQRNVGTQTTVASTAKIIASLYGNLSAGQSYDFTLRIGAPQVEAGEFAASPILPPVGSPQASTRGAESLSAALPATISAGALYAERQAVASTSAIAEIQSAMVWTAGVNDSIRSRLVSGGIAYVDTLVLAGGATIRDGGNSALLTLGQTRRDVVGFASNLSATWANGTLIEQVAVSGSPSVNAVVVPGNSEGIVYLRAIRVYAPLTDAQALALSGTGSTVIAATYDSGSMSAGVAYGIGQALHIMPSAVSGPMMVVDLYDGANPDGYLNIPLCYAGPGTEFNIAQYSDDGLDVRRADTTARGGTVITEALSAARTWNIQVGFIRDSSGAWLDDLKATAAAGRNILFVPRIGHARASSEAVFGLLAPARRGFLGPTGDYRNWSATISERL